MRAGVSTVQQTLTTEAANVLKLAVAEAQRRGHAQVTPLHVATTLLAGSSSVLRQACVQSHLHLQQPPHCRNLELCFKVALDRLQTTGSGGGGGGGNSSSGGSALHHGHPHGLHQPALSNALVAALKRAQAHQRRGYPEQQQVPLLAVKVEMEQLIISILDDPSVSRVMREASFSSTQVKSSLEEALAAAAIAASSAGSSTSAPTSCAAAQARRILPATPGMNPAVAGGISSPPAGAAAAGADRLRLKLGSLEQYGAASFGVLRNSGLPRNAAADHQQLLLNMIPPSSAGAPGGKFSGDVARVFEILVKGKKRNPLLFGEQSPHPVAEEVMRRLERGECGPEPSTLRNLRIVSPQFASIALGLHAREEVEAKLGEIVRTVEKNLLSSAGVLVYLGDLQWLVERPSPAAASAASASSSPSGAAGDVYCPVVYTVNEIGKLVTSSARVWLMAVASSQTYMRCQARHPSLDSLWGLQPLPISSTSGAGAFSLSLRSNNPTNNGSLSASTNSNTSRFGVVDSPLPYARNSIPGRWPMLPPFKVQQQQQEMDDTTLENCCLECVSRYEKELQELELSTRDSLSSSASNSTSNGLPFWLKPTRDPDQVLPRTQKLKELQRKWSQSCRSLHGVKANLSNGNKSAAGTTGGSSLAMSIPWLSLHAANSNTTTNNNNAKGTITIASTSPTSLEKNGIVSIASVCNNHSNKRNSPEPEVDIGLSLKPLSSAPPPPVAAAAAPPPPPPPQQLVNGSSSRSPSSSSSREQQHHEPEVAMVQTELVLGRSGGGRLSPSRSNGSLASNNSSGKLEKPGHFPSIPMVVVVESRHQTPDKPPSPPAPAVGSNMNMNSSSIFITTGNSNKLASPAAASTPGNSKELDFKALCKALSESVPWQKDAIDGIASTVLHCRSGGEKRRGISSSTKYDAWLLLLGSDAPAKRRAARVLAEQVFGSDKHLFRLSLRCRELVEPGQPGRGRTPLDRLAEAVRLKPFSVVLLEDIEEADFRLRSALLKAVDRGRLADSTGREVSVANLIVVMTSSVGVEVFSQHEPGVDSTITGGGEIAGMKLLVENASAPELVTFKSGRVSVVTSTNDDDHHHPRRKGPVELDLNMPLDEAADQEKPLFERVESCEQPVSQEEQVKLLLERAEEQLSKQLFSKMSRTVVFRPFNFNKLAELVVSEINSAVLASKLSVEIESGLLQHLVAALWEGRHEEFHKWMIQVLDSGAIEKLKNSDHHPQQQQKSVIRLVAERSCSSSEDVVRLPKRIRIGGA